MTNTAADTALAAFWAARSAGDEDAADAAHRDYVTAMYAPVGSTGCHRRGATAWG